MSHYDVIIIGAGTAGLNARRAAKANGATKVVLIDGGPLGTTCARVGCMPSKLLISAANANYGVKKARVFGIETQDPVVNDRSDLGLALFNSLYNHKPAKSAKISTQYISRMSSAFI